MTSLSKNSQQAGDTNKGDHRDLSPGSPQIWIQAHAMHWNITKVLILLQDYTYPTPSHKIKSMLNKEPLLLEYNNQDGHATWYPRYLYLTLHHLPMSKLAQVKKETNFIS